MPRCQVLIVTLLTDYAHFIGSERAEVVIYVLLELKEPGCSQSGPACCTVLILYQILYYFLCQLFSTRFCPILILYRIFKLLFAISDIRLMYAEVHLQLHKVHQVFVLRLLSR